MNPNFRLLGVVLVGGLLGFEDRNLLDIVQQAGGNIVTDCVCNGSMLLRKRVPVYTLVENPIESLMEKYLFNVPGPCMENVRRRVNYIIKKARDFKVHGLIYYTGNGSCNALKDQGKTIKNRVYTELLVPTLILSKVAGNEENSLEKVKSFIDIVGGRV